MIFLKTSIFCRKYRVAINLVKTRQSPPDRRKYLARIHFPIATIAGTHSRLQKKKKNQFICRPRETLAGENS